MSSKLCVAGIGEVLVDVFESGESTIGGAPFNVTFHLHQLLSSFSLGEGVFVSALGHDAWGNSIRRAAESAGMSTQFLADVERPTGSALVFERDGGAGFEIKPDVAWDFIHVDDRAVQLGARSSAVVFGSLAQRSEKSRESIRRFVSAVNGHRLYDVNLRRNTTNGVRGYSTEIIEESLKLATLVKMNDSEIDEICALLGANCATPRLEDRMRWLCEEFSLEAIAVTRGPKGALLLASGRLLQLPDSQIDQTLVHPVGAGDAFAAGLLFGAIQNWEPVRWLEIANLLSDWVVLHVSATPALTPAVRSAVRAVIEREAKPQTA
jgi:fructokinase